MERVVESGKGEGVEVRVWAVKVMSEVVKTCSDAQLAQNCHRWRATLVAALQVRERGTCRHYSHCDPPPSLAPVVWLCGACVRLWRLWWAELTAHLQLSGTSLPPPSLPSSLLS